MFEAPITNFGTDVITIVLTNRPAGWHTMLVQPSTITIMGEGAWLRN
jgi:hypothetical protein